MNLNGSNGARQNGQALIEYTLLLMMVTLVFWVGVRNSDLANEMSSAWSRVSECVEVPVACDSAS